MVQSDLQHSLDTPQGQVGRRILRATGALMIIQVIIRGFGLIEKSILGHLFGTDFQTDAYSAAKKTAFYLFNLVDQVLMHSFLPVFVQRMREHGERNAWRLASTTINFLMIFMAGIVIIGILFTPQIMPAFQPDWYSGNKAVDPRLIPLLEKIVRVMLVAVIFLATSSLTYCLLNSYKKFALPASADLALKGAVLLFAILFAHSWGPYALAVGFVCGAVAKIVVHSSGLRRQLTHYRPTIDVKDPGLRRFALLALPLLGSALFSNFRQFMDQRFISSLSEGSMSALDYARTLTDVPVAFFPYVFGVALFPFLADIAAAGDRDRLRAMLMSATRMMVLIFVPLTVFIIMLREPIVVTIYSSKSLMATEPMQLYALGMLIGALEIIVLQFYFAMSDTVRPAIVGVALVPVHIGIAYLGVYHWQIGMLAIALALLLSKGTKLVILYALIRKKLGTLEGRRTLALIGQVALSLLPLFALLWAAVHFLPAPTEVAGKARKLLALMPYGVAGGLGFVIYFTLLHALRVEEVTLLAEKVRGKLTRKAAAQ